MTAALKNKYINGWYLFALISVPICVLIVAEMLATDLSKGEGVSEMIGYSVRFAVPLIYLVVAASSVQVLFPGPFPMWWARNRKYIGLCFAVAMLWQGFFIFMMSNFFSEYYYSDVYLLRDELEGSIGYIFLPAMVLTSFDIGRKYLNPVQWRLLHKSGVYFLWAYPFSVYWWNVSYYAKPGAMDYLFYVAGFLAFASRIAAWAKKRNLAANRISVEHQVLSLQKVLGATIVAAGLAAAATGRYWQDTVTNFVTSPEWSAKLVLWLPFWPFEPYMPLFAIALGAMLLTRET